MSASVVLWGVGRRLTVAVLLIGALWAAVAWALSP